MFEAVGFLRIDEYIRGNVSMNEVIAKNRSGWILHEYINIQEEQISEYQNVTGSYAVVKVGNKYLVGYNDWRKQWEL